MQLQVVRVCSAAFLLLSFEAGERTYFVKTENPFLLKEEGNNCQSRKSLLILTSHKQDVLSKAVIWFKFYGNLGTLRIFKKSLMFLNQKNSINKMKQSKNLVEFSNIHKSINAFLSAHKTLWTIYDASSYLKAKFRIVIFARIVKEILRRTPSMKYKRGL